MKYLKKDLNIQFKKQIWYYINPHFHLATIIRSQPNIFKTSFVEDYQQLSSGSTNQSIAPNDNTVERKVGLVVDKYHWFGNQKQNIYI